jgi:ssDNA-binding Zn-finger/Zn-ribbon topoisomerase 1
MINKAQRGHDPNEHNHEHDACLTLPCPRCGCDPVTGEYVENDWAVKQWSCSMCPDCWISYEADMAPEDRPMHLIEEHFP